VVEAPVDSGALITADEARKVRRPVYAVPGPIGAAASAGANGLIASGKANALTGAAMLLEALGARASVATVDGDDLALRVLDALAAAPADPDALARRLGIRGPAFATVRTGKEHRARHGQRRCAGAPGRIHEAAARTVRPERGGPTEVRAGGDLVDLVLHQVACVDDEARARPWIERHPAGVAQSERVDGGWRRLALEGGVVAWDRPVGVQSQHLTV